MPHLTAKEQELLQFILKNRYVSFRIQRIFGSRRFFDTVKFLRLNRYINPVCSICKRKIADGNGNTCNAKPCVKKHRISVQTYELTLGGEILASEISSIKR